MSTDQQLIDSYFNNLDQHLRKASVAQIGGFRPTEEPITSWFGGGFVALPDEDWPSNENGLMIPLLQVRADELPHKPAALNDIALLNVFMDCKEHPMTHETGGENGNGWLIRTYESLDGLVPIERGEPTFVKPFQIKWLLKEKDEPTGEQVMEILDLEDEIDPYELDDEQAYYAAYEARYPEMGRTKFGGWPDFIQGSLDDEQFVFQIGSEEKPNWMWGDNGNGYFFRDDDGGWRIEWDCY